MKMTKIYTKTGDKGTTSLVGGVRVSKADIRLDAYGTIDELNSFIGLLISVMKDAEHEELLCFVQHKLFSLGSYLATDLEKTTFPVESHISVENVQRLEQAIDEINASLPSLAGFIRRPFVMSVVRSVVGQNVGFRPWKKVFPMNWRSRQSVL